jgi:hypothetical protein
LPPPPPPPPSPPRLLPSSPRSSSSMTGPIYTDLANFCRQAPVHQVVALWQRVGEVYSQRLRKSNQADGPVWLSTSGMGVAWLHVRLDQRPKYYTYAPYKIRPQLF